MAQSPAPSRTPWIAPGQSSPFNVHSSFAGLTPLAGRHVFLKAIREVNSALKLDPDLAVDARARDNSWLSVEFSNRPEGGSVLL